MKRVIDMEVVVVLDNSDGSRGFAVLLLGLTPFFRETKNIVTGSEFRFYKIFHELCNNSTERKKITASNTIFETNRYNTV